MKRWRETLAVDYREVLTSHGFMLDGRNAIFGLNFILASLRFASFCIFFTLREISTGEDGPKLLLRDVCRSRGVFALLILRHFSHQFTNSRPHHNNRDHSFATV